MIDDNYSSAKLPQSFAQVERSFNASTTSRESVVKIAEHVRRCKRVSKHVGEDVSMYWNATRFLWRVFTHPKNQGTRGAASSLNPSGTRPLATPYRLFTLSPVRAPSGADDHMRAASLRSRDR